MRSVRHTASHRRRAAASDRRAARRTMPPCWWRRRAPARPRACRWCCSTSRGRRTKRFWCWSRAGSPPAPPPPHGLDARASRSATRWACACASARRLSKRTRIEVITEGVFTRLVLDDPSLDGVAAVLFDEFHERSLDADLGLALARDVQQGLREDLKILVMSATLDGARVAALLGDAPVVESEGRAFPVETRYLGRDPRAPIERQVADAVAARVAGGQRLAAGVPAGRRRNPPHRDAAEGAHQRRQRRYRRALRRARCARAGPRHFAGAGRAPQGGAGDLDRGNLAHHRRRARGDRQRPVARAALRAGCRPDAAGNRAGVARGRRPAARPRRAHRAGRLLPAVGRAADRFARALYAAGNSVGRSVVLRARSGAMGRERSGQAGLSRSAAAGRAQRSQGAAAASLAPSMRKAASPRKAASCALCRCRRGWRAWWSMPARKAPASWPRASPRCSPNAGSAATMSICVIGSISSAATARAAPRMHARW